jgi:hypothetical protein
MNQPPGYREGDVYVTVRPDAYWNNKLRAVKATQEYPGSLPLDAVVIKIRLKVASAAFEPLKPEAVVVVPTHLTEHAPVAVEAIDPARPTPEEVNE